MQRFQDGSGFVRRQALQGLTAGALAFCCVVALLLVELAINHRSASELISQAARAELGAPDQTIMTASPMATRQAARAN